MKASLNLLKKFVDLENLTPEEIADKLTFAGLEVEDVTYLAKATNLVIGQIIECESHPNSDHLHILKVDLGPKYGVEQIVCGANNARKGLKVIVARVGAKLGFDNFEIKKSKIRDVESNGMCCALNELGVSKSLLSEKQIMGIEELPADATIGNENVLEYLNLDDVILDINVLANRSDVLAILNLARELGALFNRNVHLPKEREFLLKKSSLTVKIESTSCKQFALMEVKNVKVKDSPSWLVAALRSQGIRSINNIVDIGNYIMLLTGQPLHMYDLDLLPGTDFVIKDDYQGDFTALDDKTYQLNNGDIIITNGGEIGCLGGVMGSKHCAVNFNTKNIAVEAAYFKSSAVRHTSKRLGLSSDSSSYFIKGINPHQAHYVLNLTLQMLIEYADAEIAYDIVEVDNLDHKKKEIVTSSSYINNRLGTSFSDREIDETLESLNIKVFRNKDEFKALIPPYRIDLNSDADLSEEVIRLKGLDNVISTLPSMETTIGGYDDKQTKREKIKNHLYHLGLMETLTYSLVSPTIDSNFVYLNNDLPVKIKNPMTIDHSLLRRGVISSLIEVVKYNKSHQNENFAFFEVSEVTTEKQNYQELAIILNGKVSLMGKMSERNYDFYDISGIFKSIIDLLNINENRYRLEPLNEPSLHPYRNQGIYFGKTLVGVIGEIHPSLTNDLGETYILDINLDAFIDLKTSSMKMEKISRFPSIIRDYAFVMKEDISSIDLIKVIKKEGSSLVKNVEVFDVYQGNHLNEGEKSIALTVTYCSLEHTLKEGEVNALEQDIISNVNKKLGAYLR